MQKRVWRLVKPFLLLGCALLAVDGAPVVAAETGPAVPSAVLIRDAGGFWNIPEKEKLAPHPLRLDLVVFYYDSQWKLLWGENSGVGCFLPTRGAPLPMKAGQRVRLEGTVLPAAGISGDDVKVTVLTENALPKPTSTSGRLGDVTGLDAQWCTLEGYVCRQAEADPMHLNLDVLSEGRIVNATVLIGDNDPIPQLVNARVRLNFVYVGSRDPTGELRRIDAWVPSRSDVQLLGWLDADPQFSRPPIAIDQIGTLPADEPVHVIGEIRSYDPGRSITLRDASGQLVLRTEQPITAQPGDFVEIVGRPRGRNLDATLVDAVSRVVPKGVAVDLKQMVGRTEPLLKLRLTDQVMELRPEEAAQHYPTYLRGVVTWSDPKAGFFFLQDSSGGIRVRCGTRTEPPPSVGTMVAVLGVSVNGNYAPEVELKELTTLSNAVCPTAHPTTLEEALTGAQEAQRVEMRGYLRQVEHAGIWTQLNLTTATGEFSAYLSPTELADALVGSIVRLTGVCTAVTNTSRQLAGVRLWLSDFHSVQVEQARPSDPFAAPERTIGSLRQFLAYRMLDRQVRLTGVVLYDQPGRFLYLQQEDAGLLVLHRDSLPLAPGDWIEVVGLPGRDGNRLVLREAVWRHGKHAVDPAPLTITEPGSLLPDADGRLVKVRGRFQDLISDGGSHRLMIRTGESQFEARLEHTASGTLPGDGSIVELTGVYALEYDEYRRPRTFTLLLRSVADVKVIHAASWWTAPRALAIAGGFALCAALGIAWVVVLRRRVRVQTSQIRAQLENESRLSAELEKAARLESLGVLAGGIAHDFNNLLTVIMANLGLAAMDERVTEAAGDVLSEAERGARRAADLTQQLLTFAKGGDPVRRAVALPDVVREAAEFARHGSRVRCDFEIQANLPPADVDRGQISRVVHNLVLNATQAMVDGGIVIIRLAAVTVVDEERAVVPAGRYIKLTVADNGPGIAAEHLERIFEPYFSTKPNNNGLGLATVHSIVKKHQGGIRVRSEIGRGTTFDIWLPVAKEPVASIAPASVAPCSATPLRVLFMDDEEVIRRTAASVLRQLGHDAIVVADGAEVVREYENALRNGQRFDVVVVDLTVPGGLGGRAAIEVLRRLDPEVRAIVSSGYSNDPVLANYQAYGFSAVVPKPYEIIDLARAIQEVAGPTRRRPTRAPNFPPVARSGPKPHPATSGPN